MERRTVTETIMLGEGGYDAPLSDFIAQLEDLLAAYPDARFVCETEYYGEASSACVYVEYERDETDEEMERRHDADRLHSLRVRREHLEAAKRIFSDWGMDFPDQKELDELRAMDLRTPYEVAVEEYCSPALDRIFPITKE